MGEKGGMTARNVIEGVVDIFDNTGFVSILRIK